MPKKWRIHNIFHVLLLELDTTKKRQVNNMQLDFKFEASDNKEYKVDGIWDSVVYVKESAGQLPGLYYLVLWKSYPKKKNLWEPVSAIQYLQRFVTTYHKNNLEKPTATSALVDTALPMAKPSTSFRPMPTTEILIKWKCGRPANSTTTITNKQAKKS